jgi:hypothetical protein
MVSGQIDLDQVAEAQLRLEESPRRDQDPIPSQSYRHIAGRSRNQPSFPQTPATANNLVGRLASLHGSAQRSRW